MGRPQSLRGHPSHPRPPARAGHGARQVDPLVLREAVLAHSLGARVSWVPLHVEPGRSVRFSLSADPPLPYDEVFVDPSTGKVLGERKWGDITQGPKNLMSFVYRLHLHYSLALDFAGVTVLGIVALAWTVDCFVGVYLTLPTRRRGPRPAAVQAGGGRAWLARWWPALESALAGRRLQAQLRPAPRRRPVAFNLSEVYAPVTRQLLSQQEAQPSRSHIPMLSRPRQDPALSPRAAREIGRGLLAEQAALRGFTVGREEGLGYDPRRGVYTYMVRTSRDIREHYGGNTRLFFDADTGAFRGLYLPTGEAAGDTFTTWITTLHMAAIWGWPMQLFVCLMGLVVAMLGVTGVVIWWRKKASRAKFCLRGGGDTAPAPGERCARSPGPMTMPRE